MWQEKSFNISFSNNGDVKSSKVLMKGATFKENVSDIRNSKVADVVKELKAFYINVDVDRSLCRF